MKSFYAPQNYIPQSLFSQVLMFPIIPGPCVPHSLCSPVPILPRPYSSQSLCSPVPVLPRPYSSQSPCLPVPMPPVLMLPMFPSPDVPQKCFHVAIFQQIFAWSLQSLWSPKMLASPSIVCYPVHKHVPRSPYSPNMLSSPYVPQTCPPVAWSPTHSQSLHMMTPSNVTIFRVTDPLCGEFTGHQWIPHTKASDAELWCFLWSTSK